MMKNISINKTNVTMQKIAFFFIPSNMSDVPHRDLSKRAAEGNKKTQCD